MTIKKVKLAAVFIFAQIFIVAILNLFAAEDVRIKLATTTSVDNSGLLAYLLPTFEKKTGIKVDVIAVGTGKALKLGENGDVDAVLVHDPDAEAAFVAAGFGVNHKVIMKNDFILVGPADDPAGVKKAKTLIEALNIIKASNSSFISRGDESGTHKKEQKLWALVGGAPPKERYLETGQGMEATLRVAFEKRAYTLTDRGTYLAVKQGMDLVVAFEGDPQLENIYSVMAVNPKRFGHIKYNEAMKLVNWLCSKEGQGAIGSYKKDGVVLFHPTLLK